MAGFHSLNILSPALMNVFLSLAFKPGALTSNGYRGFYLALPDRGHAATDLISDC